MSAFIIFFTKYLPYFVKENLYKMNAYNMPMIFGNIVLPSLIISKQGQQTTIAIKYIIMAFIVFISCRKIHIGCSTYYPT